VLDAVPEPNLAVPIVPEVKKSVEWFAKAKLIVPAPFVMVKPVPCVKFALIKVSKVPLPIKICPLVYEVCPVPPLAVATVPVTFPAVPVVF